MLPSSRLLQQSSEALTSFDDDVFPLRHDFLAAVHRGVVSSQKTTLVA